MSSSNGELIKVIVHYQECLEKYARRQDDAKMLYCIAKLWKLPVTVEHLTETGVGRTVNSLRKAGGDVGDSAKSLVGKWKDMVAKSEDVDDQQMDVQPSLVSETENNEIEEDDEEAYYIDEARTEDNSEFQLNELTSGHDSPVERCLTVSNRDVTRERGSKETVRDKDNNSIHSKTYKDTHKSKECDIEKRLDTNKDKHGDTDKHSNKKDSSTADKYKQSSSKRKHENDNDGEKHMSKSKKSTKYESDSDDNKSKIVKLKNEEDDKEKSLRRKNSNSKDNKYESDSDNDDKHKSVKRKRLKDTNEKTSKHKQTSYGNNKYETDSDDDEHQTSKRKHQKDNKDKTSKHKLSTSENSRKNGYDSDDHKHKSVKHKHEESNKEKGSKHKNSELENNHKTQMKSDERHQKSHKKKDNSDFDDDEDIEDESSEEIEVKTHSNKSHHKEDKHRNKSRDKTDHTHRNKSSKDNDKNKHSSKSHRKDDSKSKHNSKHNSSSSSLNSSTSSSKDQKQKHHSSRTTKNTTPSITLDGVGSGSGTSFAEALGMLEPSSKKENKKKPTVFPPSPVANESSGLSSPEQSVSELSLLTNKKLEPLNINIASLLPEITPNYKPMGFPYIDVGSSRNKIASDDETLSAIMYNKISRTKVYSGNKIVWGKVPSLFDLCTRVLQDNIDALEFTGGVPYSILKPVLERANYNQLFMLEQYNPYLMEDTDELWKLHCQRDFRNRSREELETWRDMYQRCLDEREVKLRALTANIKLSQDKSLPVRQTKLAYVDSVVKPPRNIARKQAKHGTGGVPTSSKKPVATSSSKLVALATAGAAGEVAVPNPGSRAASSSGTPNIIVKPKKAPLMQKTLALMKNRFRR